MTVVQGGVYWVTLHGGGSAPNKRRPAVVVQADTFNESRIATTIVVAITSSLKWADVHGNVALRKGEGGLGKACVANVSQIVTVDKLDLEARIGTLTNARLQAVLRGVALVLGLPEIA